MIRHDAIVNVITDALSAHIKECCDENFQRGVARGRCEQRFEDAKRNEKEANDVAES